MASWRNRVDPSVVIVAATVFAVTVIFGVYLDHRRAISDERTEKQRRAICTILAALPPSPPPALQAARAVFARPGHPHDCQPVARPSSTPHRPLAAPTSTATPTLRPQVFVIPTATPAAPARTQRPAPTLGPAVSAQPTPASSRAPSPSPTCVLIVCVPPH